MTDDEGLTAAECARLRREILAEAQRRFAALLFVQFADALPKAEAAAYYEAAMTQTTGRIDALMAEAIAAHAVRRAGGRDDD